MQNYGGATAVKSRVSLPRQEAVEGYLQVKSKAPVDLLLGSDFLKRLGFMVVE